MCLVVYQAVCNVSCGALGYVSWVISGSVQCVVVSVDSFKIALKTHLLANSVHFYDRG